MRRAGEHSWRARAFAWAMARGTGPYERWMAERKRSLLGGLSGEVVEIGPGSGVNLSYLPRDVRWTGIEPNPHFHSYIRKEAARMDRPVRLKAGLAEDLGMEDASVDAVVGTLVLCSVDRVEAVLEEILRVLKPGGRFCFLEHVAAPQGSWLRRLQRGVCPVWSSLLDGCRPDADTPERIARAGFSQLKWEEFQAPLPVVSPHICGFAQKGRESA
ncbi:MAG: methyltransferase domain-containing protein [Acidobacteriota bacterium]|nr:methyltransferase domain-containing protein [Acidobacteriota bacterium]